MPENFRVSVSKAKTFNHCKKQYEFNYILKFPKKDRDYLTFGKVCHMVLEVFHKTYLEGCLLPYNVVMGIAWKETLTKYKDKITPVMRKECWDLINQYLKIIYNIKNNGMPANVIAVEKRFSLQITENILLNGAIDIVQLNPDNVLEVSDYKTTKNKEYLKNDWFQLLTYAYVILSEDPTIKIVRASYILLRHNFEHMTKDFSIDEILKIKDRYIEYVQQMISEKEFAPTTSNLCGCCDFLEFCEEGKKEVANSYLNSHKVFGEVGY
jgi:ATP-dependent helicase/DNAse subunit B